MLSCLGRLAPLDISGYSCLHPERDQQKKQPLTSALVLNKKVAKKLQENTPLLNTFVIFVGFQMPEKGFKPKSLFSDSNNL